jgi:vacuolar-type H+-ATPase subunit E/Vma4
MNEQAGSKPEHEIIEKILSDGEAQAKQVTDNARRSEQSEKRKAEAEAKKIRDQVIGQAEAKARTWKSKEVASAHIEAKRTSLRAREEAIAKVFEAIEREVAKLRESPQLYREALVNLAVEAVSAVGEAEARLKVGTDDGDIVDEAFLGEVDRRIEQSLGRSVKIALERDPGLSGGGCAALSADGRIIFDNTFRRRLERLKPELRSVVVKEVLKTDV